MLYLHQRWYIYWNNLRQFCCDKVTKKNIFNNNEIIVHAVKIVNGMGINFRLWANFSQNLTIEIW